MTDPLNADGLITILRQAIAGRYSGKPLFYWPGTCQDLRQRLASEPEVEAACSWMNVNDMAEDVIPKRAREVLKQKLGDRLRSLKEEDCAVLVVENPQLLLRYEPSSPLAIFWNEFVSSTRAVIVVIPESVPRPPGLPLYIKFRGDSPQQVFVTSAEGPRVIQLSGARGEL